MPERRRRTAENFEISRSRLQGRVTSERLEAARLALVEGWMIQSVADRFNWNSRQTVYDLVCVAWKELATFERQFGVSPRDGTRGAGRSVLGYPVVALKRPWTPTSTGTTTRGSRSRSAPSAPQHTAEAWGSLLTSPSFCPHPRRRPSGRSRSRAARAGSSLSPGPRSMTVEAAWAMRPSHG